MPIYDQTYRKYDAREPLRSVRFWPITREALRLLLAKKAFLALCITACIPALGFVLYVFLVSKIAEVSPDATRIAPLDGHVFVWLYFAQTLAAFVTTAFATAGLVANDRRTGGILVYLSRPLTRRDYAIGKFLVPLVINTALTVGPGLVLYGVALAIAPDPLRKTGFAALGPAVALYGLLIALVCSGLGVAISALTTSARVAGLAFFMLVMALDPVVTLVRAVTRSPRVGLFSVRACLESVGAWLLRVQPQSTAPPPLDASLLLLAILIGSLAVLRSQVRAVEIVK